MSVLGARTKKVTTYGKKQTRIINIHADFSPGKPSPPGLDAKALTTPVKAARRPLQSKDHLHPNAPSTPLLAESSKSEKVTKVMKEGRLKLAAPRTPRGRQEEESLPRQHHARRIRKVLLSRSPLNSPQGGKSKTSPMRKGAYGQPRVMPTARLLRGETLPVVETVIKQLREVDINDPGLAKGSEAGPSRATFPDMSRLLSASVVDEVLPFDSAFSHAKFMELLPSHGNSTSAPIVHKLGEASYSEVFSVSATEDSAQVVVKVIPLLGFARASDKPKAKAELPDCSEVDDVVREVEITKRMSLVPGGGFVDFLGTFVVEGQYPQQMLDEWDKHRSDFGTESIRPDVFPSSQRYALIVLSNGGTDLESFQFENTRGWVQAAAVFWQVADALGRAEEWTNFEHRDLHEGQILIRPVDCEPPAEIQNYLDPLTTGVQATVIDFGLSRLDMDSGTASTSPPVEVFEGEGNQWDVYRAMRDRVGDDEDQWTGFHPITNALWLQYLVGRLLRSTRTLRKPYARRATGTRSLKTPAALKAQAAKARAETAWAMLACIDVHFKAALSSKRPTRDQSVRDLTSARAIMAWGKEQGWVA